MILAAGLGTRFRPHTQLLPKPALPFLNAPLLAHAVYASRFFTQNSSDLAINTHHLPEKLELLIDSLDLTPRISYESELLGNGGGLTPVKSFLKDSGHLDRDFFVLNSDTALIPSSNAIFQNLLTEHKNSKALATFLLMPHPEVGQRFGGIWLDDQNNVVGFGKTPPQKSTRGFHFVGVRIFSQELLELLPGTPESPVSCDILIDIVEPAIQKGATVRGVVDDGATFYEGSFLEQYLEDSALALKNLLQTPYLIDFAKIFWPHFAQRESLFVGKNSKIPKAWREKKEGTYLVGNDCNIDDSVEFEDFVIIGNGVKVGPNTHLSSSVIHDKVEITAESRLKNKLVLNGSIR